MEKDSEIININQLIKNVKHEVGEIGLHASGILINRIYDDSVIEIENIRKMAQITVELANNKRRPLMVLPGLRVDVSKEARNFRPELDLEYPHMALAEAIVVKDLATRIAVHFYYMFRNPGHPYKVFSNVFDASQWLKTYL